MGCVRENAMKVPFYGHQRQYLIMMAACRSAVQRGKVMLPLGPGEPELEALKRVLSQ